jgi:hypothetical protein
MKHISTKQTWKSTTKADQKLSLDFPQVWLCVILLSKLFCREIIVFLEYFEARRSYK